MKRRLQGIWTAGLVLVLAAAAYAQAPAGPGAAVPAVSPRDLWQAVLSTVVFGLLGIVLAIVGFKLFDLAIPFSLETEICEKNNLAVALLASAVVLGICIIVAFVVVSP